MRRTERWRSRCIWIALFAGASVCSVLLPPVIAYQSRPQIGLAVVLLTACVLVISDAHSALHGLRWAGAAALWAGIAWCVLSQPAPLTQPLGLAWSVRGIPLVLAAALWLSLLPQKPILRRAMAAVVLPTVVALALVAWASPPRPLNFAPYYLAVDSHGTLYASDVDAPVIRVFAPDGSLRAKLRPGLASLQGPPGPGFSPPGPFNDPERLGVSRAVRGTASQVSTSLVPWPLGTDDFWFCGLAIGSHDRLYVPDWQRGRMLRFAPNGRLEALWPLPAGYHPSLGCVATYGDTIYLSDERGQVLAVDSSGHPISRWDLSEPIVGGISTAQRGGALYVLARTRVYQLDTAHARPLTSWPLPEPQGALGRPYQALLAVDGGVVVTDLAAHRVMRYDALGHRSDVVASPGAWPGEVGQAGGLARDAAGNVYIADFDHRAVHRISGAGRLNQLYWSPDDDEFD